MREIKYGNNEFCMKKSYLYFPLCVLIYNSANLCAENDFRAICRL